MAELAPDEEKLSPLQMRVWFLSAMGIFLDGFDLFIVAVALPLIAVDWRIGGWMQGLVGAAAVLGAIAGAVGLGRLADKYGRRSLFIIDLSVFALSSLLSALAWNPAALVCFRFLAGVGVGADYPISAAYLAEFMPTRVRGRMLVAAFSFQALGMLFGAAVGILLLVLHPAPGAWRWMLGSALLPTLFLVAARSSLPESAHWTRHSTASTEPGAQSDSYGLLFSPAYLRRTILATVPWSLMDITLYGVGMFTPTILAAMALVGHGSLRSLDLASSESTALLDLFFLVGFAVNILLVERWGRIRLQLVGFAGMTLGLMLLALSALTANHTRGLGLVLAGFAIFNLMVNTGPNATTYLLPAELFPTRLRASGHGLAAAAGKCGAAIGIFFLPVLRGAIGMSRTVALAALVSLLGLLITWLCRIETAGRSIEESPRAA